MRTPAILVVGGAGYIGSHMVKRLLDSRHRVVTLDNLGGGFRSAVLGGDFIEGDMRDVALLDRVFEGYRIQAVMCFAAFIDVSESIAMPGKYYGNNVAGMLGLLDAMVRHGVDKLVFSSSAAVYGEPLMTPIPEHHPKAPISPYGRSKWMIEQILEDYERAHGLRSVRLRYFNAAGADPSGQIGERHHPETHLIPLTLMAALGQHPHLTIHGADFDTPDGTCVRDFVHVGDLCSGHLLALERLLAGGGGAAYNLGNGNGHSVREVVEMARQISGKEVPFVIAERRTGDPARLVADVALAERELGWKPRYRDLEIIMRHAWQWEVSGRREACAPHP